MTSEGPPSRRRRWLWPIVVGGVLVALAALCVIGFALDENHGEGVIIGATIGTALGTLALAGTTYALARATRESVRETGAELEELKTQGKLVAEQARIASEQAAATGRLADASKAGADASRAAADAAEKARIDAISPLIQCVASLDRVEVTNRERQRQPYEPDTIWYSAQLEDLLFAVTVKFVLTNVGRAPARVTFGGLSQFLEKVQAEKLDAVTLAPAERFIDTYRVTFNGGHTTQGEYVKMAFTYEGIMHGEMFDRIQWNGWVTPAIEENPGTAKQHPRIINTSGAQVIREYPNLERPEEMAEVRKNLIS